eukprot:scaffold7154_cov33-Prasinocladus_malaysianus.AAC.2
MYSNHTKWTPTRMRPVAWYRGQSKVYVRTWYSLGFCQDLAEWPPRHWVMDSMSGMPEDDRPIHGLSCHQCAVPSIVATNNIIDVLAYVRGTWENIDNKLIIFRKISKLVQKLINWGSLIIGPTRQNTQHVGASPANP